MNPLASNVSKEWHSSVTQELRIHLLNKLHMSILLHPIKKNKADQVIRYVQVLEKKMFEAANTRSEYYHLLAEKIYKLQRELEERRHATSPAQVSLDSTSSSSQEDETGIELADILDDRTRDEVLNMQQLQADFQAHSLTEG